MNCKNYCKQVEERLINYHIKPFGDWNKDMVLISDTYRGVWLEHVYDSVMLATLYPEYTHVALGTMETFINYQKEDGQLPFAITSNSLDSYKLGFTQLQEVVSFASLCKKVYQMTGDKEFLNKAYVACKKWDSWLRNNRMTSGRGLVEMFVGYDTGHDNSGRLQGLTYPGRYERYEAKIFPPNDDNIPILAVDINANFYGTEKTLAWMAKELGLLEESNKWEESSKVIKAKIFEYCFDEEDCFFYDVDKYNNKRKYLSSTIFHLFYENVLDKLEDKQLIDKIYNKHIKNPNEFWTEYPFPSMAVCDPSFKKHQPSNCWGYFSEALIALRCSLWMDDYGWSKDFDVLCEKWVSALERSYDKMQFGQELDPFTGEPSDCSNWYSSCMLFYLYAKKRLQ